MIEELNNIRKEIQEYLEIRLDMLRLHTAENISRIISTAAKLAVLGYLLFFILLFASLALGFFIGEKLNSDYLGFLSVSGIYFLLLLLFIAFRRKIVDKPVIQAIMKLFFPKFGDDETR
jgi:hypothetical protein